MSPRLPAYLLATQSDARLATLAGEGHERAFEALVQRYRRPLLGYCRRMLLSEARAEDALQQAWLRAWLALQDGKEIHNAKAWLYRIVHNTALSARAQSGYDFKQLSDTLRGGDAPEADLERRAAVREALVGVAALPEMQREALLRTAVAGHSHERVATDLGLSDGAVRGLIYRARATLRTAATALTPLPLVSWASGAGGEGSAALTGLAAGGSSAGIGALLFKGAAVAVTAGALAGGVAGAGRLAATLRTHHAPHTSTAVRAGRLLRPLTVSYLAGETVSRLDLVSTSSRPATRGSRHTGHGADSSAGRPGSGRDEHGGAAKRSDEAAADGAQGGQDGSGTPAGAIAIAGAGEGRGTPAGSGASSSARRSAGSGDGGHGAESSPGSRDGGSQRAATGSSDGESAGASRTVAQVNPSGDGAPGAQPVEAPPPSAAGTDGGG
jgi:RNA polymerase sigma factor (sigma-70 family)